MLQNYYMYQNVTCAQTVYLLQSSELFENEIKNQPNLLISINIGLMFKLLVAGH